MCETFQHKKTWKDLTMDLELGRQESLSLRVQWGSSLYHSTFTIAQPIAGESREKECRQMCKAAHNGQKPE
jgi:hypothetical protein